MKMMRLRWLMPLLIVILAQSACARLPPPAARALPLSGPALIVIAPQPIPPEDQASEAYADWAGYLNDFAASKPATLRIIRMTPARWKQLVHGPLAQQGYASAFLRSDGSALFYDGMILEPDLYRQGAIWISSGETASKEGFTLIHISSAARRSSMARKAH